MKRHIHFAVSIFYLSTLAIIHPLTANSFSYSDHAQDIVVDSEGTVYVLGNGLYETATKPILICYDSSGVEKWTWRPAYTERMWASKLLMTSDGHLHIFGKLHNYDDQTRSTSSGIFIYKIDVQGMIVWEMLLNDLHLWIEDEVLATIDKDDNIYFAAMVADSIYINDPFPDILTRKFNQDGEQLWSDYYNGPDNGHDEIFDLVVDDQGNLYSIGRSITQAPDYTEKLILKRYDPFGNTVWTNTITDAADRISHGYTGLADSNHVYFAADPADDLWLAKYNSQGDSIWSVTLNDTIPISNASMAAMTTDKNRNAIIVASYLNSQSTSVLKFNTNGQLQFMNEYAIAEYMGHRNSLYASPNGDIAIGGRYPRNPSFGHDLLTRRVDNAGEELWQGGYIGSSGADTHQGVVAIAGDSSGNTIVTGTAEESETGADIITISYDLFGNENWRNSWTGPYAVAIDADRTSIPKTIRLLQNYPNPFNPETQITFAVSKPGVVKLTVYDTLGRPVRTILNSYYGAGKHIATWDGTDNSGSHVAGGIYFYRLKTAGFQQTRKMLLVR